MPLPDRRVFAWPSFHLRCACELASAVGEFGPREKLLQDDDEDDDLDLDETDFEPSGDRHSLSYFIEGVSASFPSLEQCSPRAVELAEALLSEIRAVYEP